MCYTCNLGKKKGGAIKLRAGCASLERFGGIFYRLLWVLLRLKNLRSPQKKTVSLSWVLAQRSRSRASEKSQERWFWLHRPWLKRPPAVFLFPVLKTVSSIMCLKTVMCMIFSFLFFIFIFMIIFWWLENLGKGVNPKYFWLPKKIHQLTNNNFSKCVQIINLLEYTRWLTAPQSIGRKSLGSQTEQKWQMRGSCP